MFEKKTLQNIYVIFTSFQFKIIYMSTLGQFCVVSVFACVGLFYFFFIIKRELLIDKTLREIESAVAKQTKKCDFVSFKTFCQRQFFTIVKEMFKNIF